MTSLHALLFVVSLLSTTTTAATSPAPNPNPNPSLPRSAPAPVPRHVEILNDSGNKMGVYWEDPSTHKLIPIGSEVQSGSNIGINSFVNHTLTILSDGDADSCADNSNAPDDRCRAASFTVSDDKEQVLVVRKGLEIESMHDNMKEDTHITAIRRTDTCISPPSTTTSTSTMTPTQSISEESKALLADCKARAFESIGTSNVSPAKMQSIMSSLFDCMQNRAVNRLMAAADTVNVETKTRLSMADKLENYTCADPNLPTTTPIATTTWTHNGIERDVLVMHNRTASKIHVIKNFITAEECDAVHAAANPILHKATVADGKGGSEYSATRKAMQAGVRVPWEKEADGHGIATVSRRLYDYINQATGYNIEEAGQEDLMSIQYQGRGDDDPSPDNYRPHCDGDCSGLDHKRGGRVATMVMYCTAPDKGGSTNFRNANVHVKPELHAAVFFSYLDKDTNKMDTGWTEHSGCPVREGKKSIAVQWLRIGVDEENPWNSFNTLTVSTKDQD